MSVKSLFVRRKPARWYAGSVHAQSANYKLGILSIIFVLLLSLGGAAFVKQQHASAAATPVGDPANYGTWNMVFDDEFDGTALDQTKWTPQRGTAAKGYYGDPFNPTIEGAYFKPANTTVSNGNLAFTIKNERTSNYAYSSGMVQSGEHFSYKYGYVEARIKVPNCAGCWPAFWELDEPVDDHWPPEIDNFEFFDTSTDKQPNFNYHWGTYPTTFQSGPTAYGSTTTDYTADYHVYGMYWDASRVQVFLDGQPGPTYTDAATITAVQNYIVLNLSTYKSKRPAAGSQMLTDYVRVWQLDGGATTPPPAPSVVSVNDNTIGTADNQFNYSGNWAYGTQTGAYQNDNHWSSNTNDTYSMGFSGTKVDLYAAKAPNHGIGAVSIDGGPETTVDFYASGRVDNVLMYSSPTLADGHHTVSVRVTGTKNSKSKGAYIPADRLDVTAPPVVVTP